MRNTRMLQKLLQIEKVHIFPILIIGLSDYQLSAMLLVRAFSLL